jgi:hypothetical protein
MIDLDEMDNSKYYLLFRTPDQLRQQYDEINAHGRIDPPHFEHLNSDFVIFLAGMQHSNDLANPQHDWLKKKLDKLLAVPGEKLLVTEGNSIHFRPGMNRDQLITEYGEAGSLFSLAQDFGYKLASPEPKLSDEIKFMVEKFELDKVLIYYFARQLYQWARGDYKLNPDWKDYMQPRIQRDNQAVKDAGLTPPETLDDWIDMYQKHHGELELDPKGLITELSSPIKNPVPARSNILRDQMLFDLYANRYRKGLSTIGVYGSGHLLTIEPALKALVSE